MIVILTLPLSLFGFFNLLGINAELAKTQLIYIFLSLVVFFFLKRINKKFFFDNSHFLYWFFILILSITFIIGLEVKGSRRWLSFYFFNFQPSEILKIFYILYLSNSFTHLEEEAINNFFISLKTFIATFIPFFIIFRQPDLGNSLVYLFIYSVFLLFSSLSKKSILKVIIIFSVLIPLFWNFLKPYQKARITSFFNPHLDYQGTAYNMIQSKIAIGSGMMFGRGLGYGTQSNLSFLPESTTDFAYASMVEQFGFFVGFLTIILYLFIFYFLFRKIIALVHNKDSFSREQFYYLIGFSAYLFFQVFINIGMNLGLLPVVGVALPLISYGGSSILTFFLGLMLAQ